MPKPQPTEATPTEPMNEGAAEAVHAAPVEDASVSRILSSVETPPVQTPAVATPRPAPLPGLALAVVHKVEEDHALVQLGAGQQRARIDPSVHPTVIAGAQARGERVLVEVDADGTPIIVGALRTQPTPGIDAAEQYTIEAGRVAIRAGEELSLSARAAGVVLRAVGEVETYADRILSRAEGVHKIVGRMLRLN